MEHISGQLVGLAVQNVCIIVMLVAILLKMK